MNKYDITMMHIFFAYWHAIETSKVSDEEKRVLHAARLVCEINQDPVPLRKLKKHLKQNAHDLNVLHDLCIRYLSKEELDKLDNEISELHKASMVGGLDLDKLLKKLKRTL